MSGTLSYDLDPRAEQLLLDLLQGKSLPQGVHAVLAAGHCDLAEGSSGIKEPTLRLTLATGHASYLMTSYRVEKNYLAGQVLELAGRAVGAFHGENHSSLVGVTIAGLESDWQKWITYCKELGEFQS